MHTPLPAPPLVLHTYPARQSELCVHCFMHAYEMPWFATRNGDIADLLHAEPVGHEAGQSNAVAE